MAGFEGKSPYLRAGAENQQASAFAAVAQRQHEQAHAPILAAVGIAHHGTFAIIDLGLLPGRRLNDRAGFRCGRRLQLAHVARHALITSREAATIHQILPDGTGIAALCDAGGDGLLIRWAGTRRAAASGR